MPSQLDNMTSRKRKSSSEVRASRKVGFETTAFDLIVSCFSFKSVFLYRPLSGNG